MNHRLFCLFSLCFALTACSGGERPTGGVASGEADATIAQETAPESATEPFEPDPGIIVDEAFLTHMHAHADMLDEINYALADGNLEAAMTPAYWLSKHHDFEGMPQEWKPYVDAMRKAAAEVESAPNLETARAAAARIDDHCRDCHKAAGVTDEND
jgi:cytochrome c556